jgi:hypothetical protein
MLDKWAKSHYNDEIAITGDLSSYYPEGKELDGDTGCEGYIFCYAKLLILRATYVYLLARGAGNAGPGLSNPRRVRTALIYMC